MKTQICFLLLSLIFLLSLRVQAQDSLLYIVIRDATDGGGREVDQVTMTSDDSLLLYAAGYDHSHNFIGDLAAKWSVSGDLDQMPVDSTKIFVFSPSTAQTSGTIIANVGIISHHTETISVDVGSHCFFILYVPCPPPVEILGQEKAICLPEIEDTTFASGGDYILVGGESYDCDENYRGENSILLDLPVSIDSTNFIYTGTLSLESSQILVNGGILLQFNKTGQGRVILNGADTSGVIIVQEPIRIDPAYIQIRSAPDGEGKVVRKWLRSDDGDIRLYCAGYDKFGNFIGNTPVYWRVLLDYGNLIIVPDISDRLILELHISDLRIDNVRAYYNDLNLQDSTGVLYLVDNSIHDIQIRTAPDGGGSAVGDYTMNSYEETSFYAAGYDTSGNFICNQIVDWYTTGSLDQVEVTDTMLVFKPTTAPTTGTIRATVDNMSSTTGVISVEQGVICFIIIRGHDCKDLSLPTDDVCLPEYGDTTTAYVGDSMPLYGAAYDCDENFIGNVNISLYSTLIESTGTLEFDIPTEIGSSLTFTEPGQGRLIFMGTDTSGVIIVTDNPTNITTNDTKQLGFKLEQAYPNPFNPSTTIQFYLPKSEHVKLDIYNSIGQKVETLIDRQMTAGEHKVEFNAENLSSGVYYYKLITADFSDVKKFILMK